ncbi:MAG: 1,6-anhydro-N-acetylmuramyl-L-alanine amidase AmpD [Acidobacteriota bacterium]
MNIDPIRGVVEGVRFVPSPNCDRRPQGARISLLVVHGVSLPPGHFGGPWVEDLFCGRLDASAHPYFEKIKDLRVSCHLWMRRDGALAQYVSFRDRAWHAGESCFEGCERCNDFSIGVELEGADEVPYEPVQYAVLAELARGLMDVYPGITPARIAGHSDIAPGRKSDPGSAFDWERLRRLLGGRA